MSIPLPKFEVGEEVIVVPNTFPPFTGIIIQRIYGENWIDNSDLKEITGYFYEVTNSPVMSCDGTSGWAEYALRKAPKKYEGSFDEMLKELNIPVKVP